MIRPLRARDVPALVALRRGAFRHSQRTTPDGLAAFFHEIFFENPWRDPALPSLVYEDENGEVVGFLGVLPRRMTLRGRAVRVAVATQLMVSPHVDGLVGRRLGRAFIDGPQDLCVADTANDAARLLWQSVGGHVSPMLSLCWVRPLRPWRHASQRLATSRAGRVLRSVTTPVARVLDSWRSPAAPHDGATTREALAPAAMSGHLDTVLQAFALRPAYDTASTTWLLARAAEKQQFGPLHSTLVRDRDGTVLGWFLYHLDASGIAHVLQLAARRRDVTDVLHSLYRDAWDRDAVAVSGRAEPWLMSAVAGTSGVFTYQGPWTLLYSRNAHLVSLIERGDGFLSRLDGEWWLSF